MNIKYHVAVDNRLQRSVVELEFHLYRRIVHLVRPEDGSPLPDLARPLWQERIHTSEWHNVVSPRRAKLLEDAFITALIAQKDSPAPMQGAHGAWRHDQKDVLKPLTP